MNNFNYYNPTYIEFGKEKEDRLSSIIKMFSKNRVLIITEEEKEKEILNKIKLQLEKDVIDYFIFNTSNQINNNEVVLKGVEKAREYKSDILLAIGNENIIDITKAISILTNSEYSFYEIFILGKKISNKIPFGVILTDISNGGEYSNTCFINDLNSKKRVGIRNDILRSTFSIINPLLIHNTTVMNTIAGFGNIFVNTLNRYFSDSNLLTDNLCIAVLKTMMNISKEILVNPLDYNLKSNYILSLTLSNSNLLNFSIPRDVVVQKMANEIVYKYNVDIGLVVPMLFIKWLKYIANINNSKFTYISRELFNTDNIVKFIDKLEEYFISLSLPFLLEQVGVSDEDIIEFSENIKYAEDNTIGSYVKLTKEDIINIYRMK